MNIKKIGTVKSTSEGYCIHLEKKYRQGLTNIDGFSLLKIIWWADQTAAAIKEQGVLLEKPYKKGPDKIGLFATRSQIRPNPICISTITIISIDQSEGNIYTYFIDAFPESPVLDIKPYLPSVDISQNITVPAWCKHWPKSIEDSANFDWESEFNF